MEEYANKFFEMLRYFRYIQDEKLKIQCFMGALPQSYKDRIGFYEPRTLEEAIRKAKYFYEKSKKKPDYQNAWNNKMNEKSGKRKRGLKPSNFKNQQKQPSQVEKQPTRAVGEERRNP